MTAPASTRGGLPGAADGPAGRGAPGAEGGIGAPGAEGGRGAAIGTVAAGGAPGGRGAPIGGGIMDGAGALGAGEEATGTAEVVRRTSMGAGGSLTGAVADLGAGGGRGADGSWIGAVERLGEMSGGGMAPMETGDTGEVASRGWVAPAPGRERSVMRTVSFFKGTAAVFWVLGGGGVGVFSDSLMVAGETANITD